MWGEGVGGTYNMWVLSSVEGISQQSGGKYSLHFPICFTATLLTLCCSGNIYILGVVLKFCSIFGHCIIANVFIFL